MPELIKDINWLDILFAILLLGMVYKGARTGVGGQLLSLVGWILLLFISINYYNTLSTAIFGYLLQKWARPLSFLAIGVIIFVGIKLAERLFSIVSGEEQASIEKIGGAVVASLRAMIFFGLIGMLLLLMPVDFLRIAVKKESKSAMFFVNIDAQIYSLMTGRLGLSKSRKKDEVVKEFTSLPEYDENE